MERLRREIPASSWTSFLRGKDLEEVANPWYGRGKGSNGSSSKRSTHQRSSQKSSADEDLADVRDPYPGSPSSTSKTAKAYAPRLSYGYSCAAGGERSSSVHSGNQDSDRVVIVENVCGFEAVSAFAVLDGYGLEGYKIAAFLASRVKPTIEACYRFLYTSRENRRVVAEPPFPLCPPSLRVQPARLVETVVVELQAQLMESTLDCSFSGSSLCLTIIDGREIFTANVGCNRLIMGREEPLVKEQMNEGDLEAFPNFPAIPPVIAAAMKFIPPEDMTAEASEAARLQAERDAVLTATSLARRGTSETTKKKRGGFGGGSMSVESLGHHSAIATLRRKRLSGSDGRPPSRVEDFFSTKYLNSTHGSKLSDAGASTLTSPHRSPARASSRRPQSSLAPPPSPNGRPSTSAGAQALRMLELPGESRATASITTLPLTLDQRPDRPDEKKRLLGAGARVAVPENRANDVPRVFTLNMTGPGAPFSRILGYTAGHAVGIDYTPEISVHTALVTDRFFILATDGVWQVMTSEEAVRVVWSVCRDVLWGGGFDPVGEAPQEQPPSTTGGDVLKGGILAAESDSPVATGFVKGFGTRSALTRTMPKLPTVGSSKLGMGSSIRPASQAKSVSSHSTNLPYHDSFANQLRSYRLDKPLVHTNGWKLGKSVSRIALERAQEFIGRAREEEVAQTLTFQGSSFLQDPQDSLFASKASTRSKGLHWDESIEFKDSKQVEDQGDVALSDLLTRALIDPVVLLNQPIKSEPGYLLVPSWEHEGQLQKELLLHHVSPKKPPITQGSSGGHLRSQASSATLRKQHSLPQLGCHSSWGLVVRTSGASKVSGMGGGAEPARNYLEEFLSSQTIAGRARRRQEIAVIAACRLREAARLKWRDRNTASDDISVVVGLFEEQ